MLRLTQSILFYTTFLRQSETNNMRVHVPVGANGVQGFSACSGHRTRSEVLQLW